MNPEAKRARRERRKAATGAGGVRRSRGVCLRCKKAVDDRTGVIDEDGAWLCAGCYTRLVRKYQSRSAEVQRRFGGEFAI